MERSLKDLLLFENRNKNKAIETQKRASLRPSPRLRPAPDAAKSSKLRGFEVSSMGFSDWPRAYVVVRDLGHTIFMG